MPHSAPLILLLLVASAALLAVAALHDLGFRTVPNSVSVALLVIGVLLRTLQGDLLWGVGCGLAVFAVTYVFFRRGWMGGADVKLLAAAAVVVSPVMVPTLVIDTSMAGGVLALIYVVGSRIVRWRGTEVAAAAPDANTPQDRPSLFRRAARCELRRLRRRGPLPYAAAIATGGWFAIAGS